MKKARLILILAFIIGSVSGSLAYKFRINGVALYTYPNGLMTTCSALAGGFFYIGSGVSVLSFATRPMGFCPFRTNVFRVE